MLSTTTTDNVDPAEIAKFEAMAHRWWDPNGDFRPLHDVNGCRLDFIDDCGGLTGNTIIDVGCGGGILSEAMAARGARVTGIDMGEAPLQVARLHAMESGIELSYAQSTAEGWAATHAGAYDVVTCMEMLEHVPDIVSTITACATLARSGGHLIFSTINRTPEAYALLILGAEYIANILPKGTHDYARFIRPSELSAACRKAGLDVRRITGMRYNPMTRSARLSANLRANYLVHAIKP
ncbi:MAG: bifunctional 2-polyprenyl-6-hydroxyphenol methylase/3-demethylubiquinol 3-O-methyltransferase UbiG [Pseudomonadales bacterium]|nr:bifunctional 2-polyprenyl-6-hydroxyphenol methylase/3-demethylubiquinol 3-O-methyltransferase UbiG [Pseudomonadales bacterium]MCP5182440.1 bifunctional 2-polyprenyl-6-hydroxyphenol methylase/3-demethylubiquinol 3-O-methyltransferase UbiG [Pseudomonadales bacterium]